MLIKAVMGALTHAYYCFILPLLRTAHISRYLIFFSSNFGAELSEFSPTFGSPTAEQEESGGELQVPLLERQLTRVTPSPLPNTLHFLMFMLLKILVFLSLCAGLWMKTYNGRWEKAPS